MKKEKALAVLFCIFRFFFVQQGEKMGEGCGSCSSTYIFL